VDARGLTPILNVSDFNASVAWFELLGWRKLWDWGQPPTFGAVGSGACEIFLCLDGQGGRGDNQGVWMSVWVDDVDAVYETCVERGIEVTWPPTNEPWGVREMHIRHADGHMFRISHGLDGQPDHAHDHDHNHEHEPDHDHTHDHDHPLGG
jgi:Glyoxalase/Bleomycin resistance protein/Dioxygenase superfamily